MQAGEEEYFLEKKKQMCRKKTGLLLAEQNTTIADHNREKQRDYSPCPRDQELSPLGGCEV